MPPRPQSDFSVSSSCRRSDEVALMNHQTTTTHRGGGANQQRKPSIDNIDNKSAGSASVAAPSSVYLAGPPLSRELSDLSGSYVNGSSSRRGGSSNVPAQIFDQAFFNKGPWRQGYVLSQFPHSAALRPKSEHIISQNNTATVFVSHNDSDGVEIINDLISGELNLLTAAGGGGIEEKETSHRFPIIVLLMDTSKKSYELMQIWVDKSTDSVRDVVQTMHHSIPDKWKLDYDGIFQMRGNRFTQLINILSLEKYDAQPYELWIAKPWSMTAKVTIGFATSCIRHLTSLGIVCTDDEERPGTFRPKSAEAALVLTKTAKSRIFVEDGIVMKHHHAVQFVSLSPPMDLNVKRDGDDRDDTHSSVTGASHASFQSSSTDQRLRQELKNPMMAPLSPVSVGNNSFASIPSSSNDPLSASKKQQYLDPAFADVKTSGKRQSPRKKPLRKLVSSLNCCKNARDPMKHQHNRHKRNASHGSADPSLLLHHQKTSLLTLTEEQEQQWASFETAHHGGDVSVAGSGTKSIVSMSVPLLSGKGGGTMGNF